jgi:hypothetical protein
MHAIGGYHVGKGFVVGRPELIAWLQEARNSPEARWQEAGRERLEIAIEEARGVAGRNRRFIVSPDAVGKKLPGLPPTIQLKTGELKIEFFGTEDLLRQLFELSPGDWE